MHTCPRYCQSVFAGLVLLAIHGVTGNSVMTMIPEATYKLTSYSLFQYCTEQPALMVSLAVGGFNIEA